MNVVHGHTLVVQRIIQAGGVLAGLSGAGLLFGMIFLLIAMARSGSNDSPVDTAPPGGYWTLAIIALPGICIVFMALRVAYETLNRLSAVGVRHLMETILVAFFCWIANIYFMPALDHAMKSQEELKKMLLAFSGLILILVLYWLHGVISKWVIRWAGLDEADNREPS
jgi:Co/Zn/Cd efflux system component